MKRAFDLTLAIFLSLSLFIPIILISILIKLSSPGPVIYWSERIGINNENFFMPKFRSMKIKTPEVATHLLKNPNSWITPIGSFLRRTSLDEIPQLWSILIGHMSFVGPRPALFNQYDLIELRSQNSIQLIKPGITGWAQINGRDNLTIKQKVEMDIYYYKNKSLLLNLKIIFLTIYRVFIGKDIKH